MPTFNINFDEPRARPAGAHALLWPVQIGVPFARGVVPLATALVLRDRNGNPYAAAINPLLSWPNDRGYVRWSLVETQVRIPPSGSTIPSLTVQDAPLIAKPKRGKGRR